MPGDTAQDLTCTLGEVISARQEEGLKAITDRLDRGQERFKELEAGQREQGEKIQQIHDVITAGKGGWKVFVGIGTVIVTIATIAIAIKEWIK